MLDGVFDFLIMVLVLAIVVGLGFAMILPMTQDDIMAYSETVEDKAMLREVRDPSAVLDGISEPQLTGFTALSVVLVTQVQDQHLPHPGAITVNGQKRIEVDSTYRLQKEATGVEMWNNLPSKTGRYVIEYDYRNGGSYNVKTK